MSGAGFLVVGCQPSQGGIRLFSPVPCPKRLRVGWSVIVQDSSAPFLLTPTARMCGSIPFQIRLVFGGFYPRRKELRMASPSQTARIAQPKPVETVPEPRPRPQPESKPFTIKCHGQIPC